MPSTKPQVRAVHCDHQVGDDEVHAALKRATAPLERSWAKLKAAKRIAIKFNFGLMPQEPHGRSRGYYHHLVRMPYMLADIGRIFPTLNIVDALISQAGREWGPA